jgi:hypothetical protein
MPGCNGTVYHEYSFMAALKAAIAALRHNNAVISAVESNWPVIRNVRLDSDKRVATWLEAKNDALAVRDRLQEKGVGRDATGMTTFWLLVQSLNKVLNEVQVALTAVHGNEITKTETVSIHETLCSSLERLFGVRDLSTAPKTPLN